MYSLCQVNQKTVSSSFVCGFYCSTLLSESSCEHVAITSPLDSVSKWKKEGERGGIFVLRGDCDGDECHINAIVVIEIMSLSGEEGTPRKDNKDWGTVKLRE